jgi:hypothetical protein
MFGHFHPTFRVAGIHAPCFLVGPEMIVLPAFSFNAAGLNVTGENVPGVFKGKGLRCVVATEEGMLDFGWVDDLGKRLGESSSLCS